MNPLYLHAEGYQPEEEVQVNTILGVVFPKQVDIESDKYIPNNEVYILSGGQVTKVVNLS